MSTTPKVISIIDCFVHDQTVENNLKSCVTKLKSEGHDILLVSNTVINPEVLKLVDYHLYDKRNQLFSKEYPGTQDVDFWTDNQTFTVHNIKSGLQKHGLPVLINLFNSLRLAKELGYTHFQRFETDDLFGPMSLKWIGKVPQIVEKLGTKGFFYANHGHNPPDVSFHYFYSDIQFFLDTVSNIKCEEDYDKYLMEIQGNLNFRIVEVFLYDQLKKSMDDSLLIIGDGSTMSTDFPDTTWNTVSSASNMSSKYKGCLTGIYRAYRNEQEQDFLYLYSCNYVSEPKERKIIIRTESGDTLEKTHTMGGKDVWNLNQIPKETVSISVFENEELLYEEFTKNVKSHIVLK